MGTTNHYLIPYPELNMAPDGPSQMRGLAEKVDSSLWTVDGAYKTADAGITTAYKAADTTLTNNLNALTTRVTTLESRTADTGAIALTVSYASGWAVADGCTVHKFGPIVNVYLTAKRTGGAITSSSNGNISDTLVLTTSIAAYQPRYAFYGIIHPVSTGSPWECTFSTAGNWYIVAATRGSSVIATNDEIRGNYTFMA